MVNVVYFLPPVAKSVLQRSKHTIDGGTLSVTACNNPDNLQDREEEQESRTIEVTGLSATTTKDSIEMFFENKRRSGGGEVEHVDYAPDQGKAIVTFANAESKLASGKPILLIKRISVNRPFFLNLISSL